MLRVRDWAKYFENNRTRELKCMSWVPLPNSHDGDGYTELLDHPNGAAHFGAWVAIVQVASKCDLRGSLLRDGARPHDARSLARMTRIPLAIMDEAIQRLVNDVGWLEVVPDPPIEYGVKAVPQESAALSHEGAADCRCGAVSSIPFHSIPSCVDDEARARETGSNGGTQKTKGFVKPTIEEVLAYCKERGNNVDPERFVAYYEAQGWKLANGLAMKSWRHAVQTWEYDRGKRKRDQRALFSGSDLDPRGNLASAESYLKKRLEVEVGDVAVES